MINYCIHNKQENNNTHISIQYLFFIEVTIPERLREEKNKLTMSDNSSNRLVLSLCGYTERL